MAGGLDHEHNHGLLVRLDPQAVIEVWLRLASGVATAASQDVRPAYDVPGWLDYCRRMPGFSLSRVVTSGRLWGPWAWALGRAGHELAEPRLTSDVDEHAQLDGVARADVHALRRIAGGRRPTPHQAQATALLVLGPFDSGEDS